MRRYCFRCPECGYTVDQSVPEPAPTCCFNIRYGREFHDVVMVRDYRREAVGNVIRWAHG